MGEVNALVAELPTNFIQPVDTSNHKHLGGRGGAGGGDGGGEEQGGGMEEGRSRGRGWRRGGAGGGDGGGEEQEGRGVTMLGRCL